MSRAVRYPVPREVLALAEGDHRVVEASAGTGKTFLIEHRIVHLVVTGAASIEEILVVTFTDKATAELKRRVRALLAKVLSCREHGAEEGEPCWLIDGEARARLRRALSSFDRAQVFTIHGFCHRVLVESAFEGGRLLEQSQVADEAAFKSAFLGCLRDTLAADEALRPYLEAWLGAGRSVEELQRLLYRCAKLGGRPSPELDEPRVGRALAAAGELLPAEEGEALEAALAAAGVKKQSLGKMRRNLEALGAAARELRDRASLPRALAALRRCELGYLAEKLPPAWSDLAGAVGDLDGAAVPVEAAVAQRFLPEVFARLDREKAARGIFDFGDMLGLVWRALQGPGGRALAERLRRRYRYALIDEFQDTDETQWNIFRELFLCSGGRSLLTAVGDPKQAIYAFRGADVHAYLRAVEEIGGEPLKLEVSYRSTPPLVRALNFLFEERRGASFFRGGIRYDRPVRAGRERALRGAGGREVTPVHMLQVAPGTSRLGADALRRALGERITEEIARLLRDPEGRLALVEEGGEARTLGAGDVFVLTRTTAESEEMAERLRAAGLPCALYRQEGLFQTDEAAEIRDLLAGIAEPRDRAARLAAWRTRFFDVSLADLPRLGELADSHPLVSRLYEWRSLAERRAWAELFPRVVSDSRLVEREILLSPSERALTNYLHLFELLTEEALATHCELHELLRRLEGWIEDTVGWDGAERNLQRLESEKDAVQVMTIHKAKGLEAPVVFLYGGFTRGNGGGEVPVAVVHQDGERRLQIGRPADEARAAAADEERGEDERLMYVAATRAVGRLYLPYADPKDFPIAGAYRPLAERLSPLLASAEPELFSLEEVPAGRANGADPSPPSPGAEAALERWQPPAELLGEGDPADPELAALRAERRGPVVTSYSRQKARAAADPAPEIDAPGVEVGDDELPPGRESGLFLHEALEHLRFGTVLETTSFGDWRALPEVEEVFRRALARHDRDPRHLEDGQRLVYDALTLPVATDRGAIPSLAGCRRERREVEFFYPFGGAGGAERGFVRGYLDLVFEWEGRIYVLDWKSDLLADYGQASLAAHVAEHYAAQVELYSIALARMLGGRRERFGGLVYLFLRGRAAWFERPDADAIARREAALSAREEAA